MRPNLDNYFIRMAALVASRSTCLRRSVGCVLVNERGHVLATGYNGVAAGQPHCNDEVPLVKFGENEVQVKYPNACIGADAETGEHLDECQAIHAEQNALLQCRDVWAIQTCYTTTAPCIHCVKLLLNTSCRIIVYSEVYDEKALRLWEAAGGNRGALQLEWQKVIAAAGGR